MSIFGAKLVKGVTTKESPEWLRNALIASGINQLILLIFLLCNVRNRTTNSYV